MVAQCSLLSAPYSIYAFSPSLNFHCHLCCDHAGSPSKSGQTLNVRRICCRCRASDATPRTVRSQVVASEVVVVIVVLSRLSVHKQARARQFRIASLALDGSKESSGGETCQLPDQSPLLCNQSPSFCLDCPSSNRPGNARPRDGFEPDKVASNAMPT